MNQTELDPLLHQPVRTRLAAYVVARGEATFNELKKALVTTDGNLEGHVKKLVAAGYLSANKTKGGGRQQTFYRMTPAGSQAFTDYVAALQCLFPDLTVEATESVVSGKRKRFEWQPN
jgi:predicted ArsR family transcriptional regulator